MTRPVRGYFALVLHAHLPFVRHLDGDAIEERWLHEAVLESYLPLLWSFAALERDGVPFRLTVSLSPPLVHMLDDSLLQRRTRGHADALAALVVAERRRPHHEALRGKALEHYRGRLDRARVELRRPRHVTDAFARWARAGRIDLGTTTATHAFLPLVASVPAAAQAQIRIGLAAHARRFRRPAATFWLPECGFAPALDRVLARAGVHHTFLDAHALRLGAPAARRGAFAPVRTPAGVYAFARERATSELVWSAEEGYPGHPDYRDFYRDAGYDLPFEAVRAFVAPDGSRQATGLKLHAITHAAMDGKRVYDPDVAERRVAADAAAFVHHLERAAAAAARVLDRPPLFVAPFDAELFGHWWFEGPRFLEHVFRRLAGTSILPVTPLDYLQRHPDAQRIAPAATSWGRGGFSGEWINASNAFMGPVLDAAMRRYLAVLRRHGAGSMVRSRGARSLPRRALLQAGREILLLQSSDWGFMLSNATAPDYARRRFDLHRRRFDALVAGVEAGRVDRDELASWESEDNIFPDLSLRAFAGS